jgi:hypothetical protein
MRSAALTLVAVGVLACGAGNPGPASAASTVNASTSNLSSVFNSAQPGDTILLASGDYGTFNGGAKSGMVTLKPQDGAAAAIHPSLKNAANITFDGVSMSGLDISGTTHDIKVLNTTFVGQADLNMTGNANANILLEHDSWDNITVCGNCPEGRLQIHQTPIGTAPVGVTVSNSHFGGPGESDGVQVGAYGAVIQGNVFDGIKQGNYQRHVDSIQLYGQSHTTITGNLFKNFSEAIMSPDGGTGEIITNNVFDSSSGGGQGIQLGGQSGTVFRHNTVRRTDIGADGSNITLQDNVLVGASFSTVGCGSGDVCTVDHNLYSSGKAGTNALTGTPVWVGGANPSSYDGFALAGTSPGKGNASDGTDRGINPGAGPGGPAGPVTNPTTPPAAGTPTPPATLAVSNPATTSATTGGSTAAALSARWTFRPAKPRVGTRIILTAPKTKAGGRKCVWTLAEGVFRRGCQIAVVYKKSGVKHISVRITDRSGTVIRGTRTIHVTPRSRAHR